MSSEKTEMFCMYSTKGDNHSELMSLVSKVAPGNERYYTRIEVAALEGTGKQVAWAEDIRSRMMLKVANKRTQLRSMAAAEKKETADELVDAAFEKLCGEPSAKWFIENRSKDAMKLIEEQAVAMIAE